MLGKTIFSVRQIVPILFFKQMFIKMRLPQGSLTFQEILKANKFKIDSKKDIFT